CPAAGRGSSPAAVPPDPRLPAPPHPAPPDTGRRRHPRCSGPAAAFHLSRLGGPCPAPLRPSGCRSPGIPAPPDRAAAAKRYVPGE
ncbi:hypothetical protein EJMLMN_EJMLMN_07660, partial [Dysosmobacter welbionis]